MGVQVTMAEDGATITSRTSDHSGWISTPMVQLETPLPPSDTSLEPWAYLVLVLYVVVTVSMLIGRFGGTSTDPLGKDMRED